MRSVARYPQEFFVPYQFIYEEHRSDINAVRYNYMVDGEVLSGAVLRSIKLGSRIDSAGREIERRAVSKSGRRGETSRYRRRSSGARRSRTLPVEALGARGKAAAVGRADLAVLEAHELRSWARSARATSIFPRAAP